jgi:hypothetical protein
MSFDLRERELQAAGFKLQADKRQGPPTTEEQPTGVGRASNGLQLEASSLQPFFS